MDLSVLNFNYKRDRLVEGWSSLVWAERYSSFGDFELVSNNISQVLTMLPLPGPTGPPTLVAIDESEVPMVVETHKIVKPKNGIPQIVTSGRSFETIFDRRVTVKTVNPSSPAGTMSVDSPSVAMAVFSIAADIITLGRPNSYFTLGNVNLMNSVSESGTVVKYEVPPKELYAWMIETLNSGDLGMRSELGPSNTQIAVIIYKGEDRSEDVVFDVTLDQFEEATYILSTLGAKTTMITNTKQGSEFSTVPGGPYFGIAAKLDYQDLSSEIDIAPSGDLTNLTKNRGNIELAKKLPISLFSGSISENFSQGYGTDYFLGDTITLQGDYGLSRKARVMEFIRSQDSSGYKAYPTFDSVDE